MLLCGTVRVVITLGNSSGVGGGLECTRIEKSGGGTSGGVIQTTKDKDGVGEIIKKKGDFAKGETLELNNN